VKYVSPNLVKKVTGWGEVKFRQFVKQSDTITGLVGDLRKIRQIPVRISRRNAIKRYLESNEIKKLQLGAGITSLAGWLNTDVDIKSDGVVYLDVTQPFPIDNDTFDYVYGEHVIEHISWHDGLGMLQECRRILKPGGTIRIATPDLKVLLGLYVHDPNPIQDRYIRWITDEHMTDIPVYRASFVINNAFRKWGHQFLYDGESLKMVLEIAGFSDIKQASPDQSMDKNLRGIEAHGKNVGDEEMTAFETMVFEAKCPN